MLAHHPSNAPRRTSGRNTYDEAAVVDRIVTRAKRRMLQDLAKGRIPPTREYAQLHDHVDANMYLLNGRGELDRDVLAIAIPEVPGTVVDVPSEAINVDEVNRPYEIAQQRLVVWLRDGGLSPRRSKGAKARKRNRGPIPDATHQWPSPTTGLTYRITPTADGVRTEVFWADKFRGIREHGRTVYDRLARHVHEALARNEAAARAMTRGFDDAFLQQVATKYNGRKRSVAAPEDKLRAMLRREGLADTLQAFIERAKRDGREVRSEYRATTGRWPDHTDFGEAEYRWGFYGDVYRTARNYPKFYELHAVTEEEAKLFERAIYEAFERAVLRTAR